MDKISIGIATVPSRVWLLYKVIESVYNQVDEINVYLNNYCDCKIPQFLQQEKIKYEFWNNTYWDAWKFFNVPKWYFFSIDDDIIYPKDYILYWISKIEDYKRKAVVWYHWAIFDEHIDTYYNSRKVLHFKKWLEYDTKVHILWTGTTGFHTDTIEFNYTDCRIKNMADIRLWKKCQELWIPMICLARPNWYLIELPADDTIYNDWKNKDAVQTWIVKTVDNRQLFNI